MFICHETNKVKHTLVDDELKLYLRWHVKNYSSFKIHSKISKTMSDNYIDKSNNYSNIQKYLDTRRKDLIYFSTKIRLEMIIKILCWQIFSQHFKSRMKVNFVHKCWFYFLSSWKSIKYWLSKQSIQIGRIFYLIAPQFSKRFFRAQHQI